MVTSLLAAGVTVLGSTIAYLVKVIMDVRANTAELAEHERRLGHIEDRLWYKSHREDPADD